MANIGLLAKAALIAGATISVILLGLSYAAHLITLLLGLPPDLGLPSVSALAGWLLIASGGLLALWLLRYRRPETMIVSTYFTFVKMFTRSPMSDFGGRKEALVVEGPQRYARNPLYLSATTIFFGWSLVTDSTSSLITAAFFLAWLAFVQIPFEERELRAMFGEQWVSYSKDVPMLIPFIKVRRSRRPAER